MPGKSKKTLTTRHQKTPLPKSASDLPDPPDPSALTSLGVPLLRQGSADWNVDLTHLKLFKGLSVIARVIGDAILEQIRVGNYDIVSQHRIIADITPELGSLVSSVSVYARSGVLNDLPNYQDQFHIQLRTVFGTVQRPRWGSVIFPELFGLRHAPRALLFPFHVYNEQQEIDYYFLVERTDESAGSFLRITIERENDSRMNLAGIPHRVVDDLDRRAYLQGLTRITESVYQGLLRECENHRTEYTDNARRNSHFFEQLSSVGLGESENLTVRWPAERNEYLVRSPRRSITDFMKRVFIVLEDRGVVEKLRAGDSVEITAGKHSAFLDLSRRNRCLNVSLDRKRDATDLDYYLDRMPRLRDVGAKHGATLKNYRVFLIHHITGEILATIKAIENMSAANINVLFVKYAGVVPPDYLETLLTLPESRFRFNGLQKVETEDRIEGYYILSRQYSDPSGLEKLESALEDRQAGFFDAMRYAAGHLFFREALAARANDQRILLIEDGGYLAPELNDFCLRGKNLGDALKHFGIPEDLYPPAAERKRPLGKWLGKILPGSVEHTRNGYNRLEDVQTEHGGLSFPACTIAVSDVKRGRESEEVSISILHAIESILHGIGLVFSQRRVLVLGSRGAIGRNLMEDLSTKVGARNLIGVDIVLKDEAPPGPWRETAKLEQLAENDLYDIDMILGVIGQSILERKQLERIVLNCKRPFLFFASGSTKTAEFTHLSEWIRGLQAQKNPKVGGVSVELSVQLVRDPQTAHIVASRVRFHFQPNAQSPAQYKKLKGTTRDLFLLGGLTPINFLFYGVPTETMDAILAQLMQVAAGLVERTTEKPGSLPKALLAVDHQVDADARLLSSK
jgi:hypothetical protein